MFSKYSTIQHLNSQNRSFRVLLKSHKKVPCNNLQGTYHTRFHPDCNYSENNCHSFTRNGSYRAVLKPLRDGLRPHPAKPLTAPVSNNKAVLSGAFLCILLFSSTFSDLKICCFRTYVDIIDLFTRIVKRYLYSFPHFLWTYLKLRPIPHTDDPLQYENIWHLLLSPCVRLPFWHVSAGRSS